MTATSATHLYVNLPVADLGAAVNFFRSLGFSFNQQFTDDTATCMVVGPHMNVMLLTKERFESFSRKPVSDATQGNEVLVCLGLASRAEVDDITERALAAGGKPVREAEDHGFMYGRSFHDLDGHVWELIHMDLDAFRRAQVGG